MPKSYCNSVGEIVSALVPALLSISLAGPASADSIGDAVAKALSNNNARKAAVAAIEAQGKQVSITQGERGPRVRVFGELAGERVNDPTSLSPEDNKDLKLARGVGFNAEYSLLDGLRSINQIYREATLLDAEIIRLSDATETLALNAVQAYVDVVRHRSIVGIARQNVRTHAEIVQQVGQQIDAGKLSEADRFRANDKLLASNIALSEAKEALSDAESTYLLTIGAPPGSSMSVYSNARLPSSRDLLESSAVANSFQLKLAQNDINVLTYEGAIDAADWQPQLDLFAGADYGYDRAGSSGDDSNIAAGLRLNWTLYRGGTREMTAARSKDLVMRAHYRKKQLEHEVRDLARRAWNAHSAAIERKALLDRSVSTNVSIVEAFRREFEAAKRPLLQVLDAERALFNLRVRKVNAGAAVAFQAYRVLAAQNTLAGHFGVSHSGEALLPDYERRAKENPNGGFNVSAPPLE